MPMRADRDAQLSLAVIAKHTIVTGAALAWLVATLASCVAPDDDGAADEQSQTSQTSQAGETDAATVAVTPTDVPPATEASADEAVVDESDSVRGAIESGDTLGGILQRAGIAPGDAAAIATVFAQQMDPSTLRIGQTYEIELDDAGKLRSFALQRSRTQTVRVVPGTGNEPYRAELDETKVTVTQEEVGGTIRSSLWAAMIEGGHDPSLVDAVVDVFAYDIDFFTATRQGDTFRLVVEREEAKGEFVRYGRVLAAEYTGSVASARIYWWQPSASAEGRYVDDEGRGVTRSLLKTPLKYSRISSGFNPARMHPVLHRVKSHKGVDYAAPEGTPVWSAADGTIVFRARQGGAGNMVIVRHDNGLKTLYMHLSKFKAGQSVGQRVKAKTVIGYVGKTGLATGPHLHFGVQKNGKYVDPKSVEPTRGVGVAASDRGAFAAAKARLIARLQSAKVQ